MRLAVTGGLVYTDRAHVYAILDALHPVELAHGGAVGADSLAHDWSIARGVARRVYKAKWSLGGWGGPIRNGFMLDDFRPDLLVVFSGDRGTFNCLGQAQEREVPYLVACSDGAVEALRAQDPRTALIRLTALSEMGIIPP